MSKNIQVYIKISYDRFIYVYSGEADEVYARSVDGRNVRFPAEILKPFLTHNGIEGMFNIEFNSLNKFKSIKKIN